MSKKIKIVLVVVFTVLIFSTLSYFLAPEKQRIESSSSGATVKTYDPPFTKEGELDIVKGKSGEIIQKLSIEIVDNEEDMAQGLMYRSSMLDTLGMLFIYEEPGYQSFWMKNTKIPLDIMFVDSDYKIVKIVKNTTPYSENSIPSEHEIVYVLEVNAGFSDRKGVENGDMIRFTRTDKSVM